MMVKAAMVALVGLVAATEAASIHQYRSPVELEARQNGFGGGFGFPGTNNNAAANNGADNNGANNNGANNNAAAGGQCLQPSAIQKGSASTGQQNGVAADGQVNSATDFFNFVNFCVGSILTDGQQIKNGSCNGIPMGMIPSISNMVSTVIINPKNGDDVAEKQTFNVQVNVANMQLGSFTNATSTYYSAPQDLQGGKVVGHTHVVIQDLGNSLNPTTPLDATKFAFFKGINDAGNGNGQLTTAVTGGLPAGNYRLCTMSSASNHQPVLMPVAQRGAQDDCVRFTVSAGGGNSNAGAKAGANTGAGTGTGTGTGTGANSGNSGAASSTTPNSAGTGNSGSSTTKDPKTTQNPKATNPATANDPSTASNPSNNPFSNPFANPGSSSNTGSSSSNTGSSSNANLTSTAGSSSSNSGSNSIFQALGGIAAPQVINSGDPRRPFSVNGNTFVNMAAAVQRACAIQNNACADACNSGRLPGHTVGDCNNQEAQCNAAGAFAS